MSVRILFLVPADYGALQRKGVVQSILERDEHGYFERVVTVHPAAARSQVIDLNPVHRVIEFDLGRALASDAGWWLRIRAPIRLIALAWHLRRIIREERIDIIRANDPYLMGLFAWAAAGLTGRRFCVSIHADYDKNFELTTKGPWGTWLRTTSRWVPRFVFRRADLVMPIRRHLATWAERHGARSDRIRIIPHGVSLAPFREAIREDEVRICCGVPGGAPIVSFVGRLSRYNYVYDVVKAAERVLASRPDAVFLLLGDGEERGGIERWLASRPQLAGRIHITGFRPAEEVVGIRRVSAVSLCPMGGFSLIEACAAGSPVIAYDVDWHGEIIEHERTGLLVREGDVDGLAAAALRLLRDRSLAARLGANARAFVEAHHDEPRTSAIKCDCYRELLRTGEAA